MIATAVGLLRHHAGDRTPVPRLSATARRRLVEQAWEPDLAGLEACLQRALILCDGPLIEPEHLALGDRRRRDDEQQATDIILQSLKATGGQRRAAAARLGIAPRTLRLKLADLRASGLAVPGVEVSEEIRCDD